MEDLKTAQGQLAISSEFRFLYWRGSHSYEFYVVKRGRRHLEDRWAILEGSEFGACWNGDWWITLPPEEQYCYTDLEEALVTAKGLAFKENQRIVETLERKFPGEFRGGPYDLTTEEKVT